MRSRIISSRGGDARTAEWLVRAGNRARLSYAFVTAVRRYEAALARMDSGADDHERGWVAYHLATMYFYFSPERGLTTLDTVIAAAENVGDRTLGALARFQRGLTQNLHGQSLAGIDDIVAAFSVLESLPPEESERIRRNLGTHYSLDADRAAVARQLSFALRPEAFPLAERLVADPDKRRTYEYASGAYALALLATTRGQPHEARRRFTEAREAYHASGVHMGRLNVILHEIEVRYLAYAPDATEEGERLLEASRQSDLLANNSGVAGMPIASALPLLILHGDWAQAKQDARSLASSTYFLARVAAARCLAFLGLYQGEPEGTARYIEEMLPHGSATAPGTSRFHYATEAQRLAVSLALVRGDLAAAQEWLTAHDRWLVWADAELGQAEGQALWADYYRHTGDVARATGHAERSLSHATEPRQPLALLAAHRLRGELATTAGQHSDAERHLQAALTLAHDCAAPHERALTLMAIGELRAATGNDEAATAILDDVHAICDTLGARPMLNRIDALRTRIATLTTAAPAYPAGLSAREVDVLRLVAQGLTNGEVAERLFLSPRTVSTHLQSIYSKLGVSTRTAASAFAIQHRLV
jgi:ATP/maltotriose-dependent transcriptional regulator MalT